MNCRSSAKASIRKRKLNSLSSLAPTFGGASGSRRLAARAQASPFGTKRQLAGRTLTPKCRLRAEKGAPCGRIDITCTSGWMRTNVPRWKRAASQRPAAVGLSAQADPRRKHSSRALRGTSQAAHGNPPDRQQHQPACAESECRICQPRRGHTRPADAGSCLRAHV